MFRQTLEKLLGNTHRLIDVIDGVLTAFSVSQRSLPENKFIFGEKAIVNYRFNDLVKRFLFDFFSSLDARRRANKFCGSRWIDRWTSSTQMNGIVEKFNNEASKWNQDSLEGKFIYGFLAASITINNVTPKSFGEFQLTTLRLIHSELMSWNWLHASMCITWRKVILEKRLREEFSKWIHDKVANSILSFYPMIHRNVVFSFLSFRFTPTS